MFNNIQHIQINDKTLNINHIYQIFIRQNKNQYIYDNVTVTRITPIYVYFHDNNEKGSVYHFCISEIKDISERT